MSKYIATRAVRGANALVYEAETMLHKALADKCHEFEDVKKAFLNDIGDTNANKVLDKMLNQARKEAGS